MAILINGNGNPAIYPDQDADWFASIFGGQTAITGVGSQFAAEIQDANTIALADGVIITKEGRRIQLDANQSDIFEIPTGAQGTTNYYIIGYCLTTNDDSSQTAETFVELMENATDTIEEDTFRDGADKVYVSLYRVTQTGFNLETPELLLPQVGSIIQLNADLSANNNKFYFDYQNGKYGYNTDPSRGAGTFSPFSKSPTQGSEIYRGFSGSFITLDQTIPTNVGDIIFMEWWHSPDPISSYTISGLTEIYSQTYISQDYPTYGAYNDDVKIFIATGTSARIQCPYSVGGRIYKAY